MKRRLTFIIVSIVIFKLILGMADYSFSSKYLNYALITLAILGSFYLFLTLRISKWIKTLIILIAMGAIGYLGVGVAPYIVMGTEEVEVIDKWKYENQRIWLTSRIGFSGPPSYRYEIHRPALFGLVYKHIDQVTVSYDNLEICLVDFPNTNMTFHKCEVIMKAR